MAVGAARAMVCYKETHATVKLDPVADEWTGTWRDGRAYNPVGAQPENGLSGTIYMVDTWANYPILVPHAYAALELSCPIYATLATAKMALMELYDAHEAAAPDEGYGFGAEPPWSLDDVDHAFSHVVELKYSQLIRLSGRAV